MEELYSAVRALFNLYQPLAHDIKHAERTAKLARQIALGQGYDPDEAEITGLLHDLGRTVRDPQDTHAHLGAPMAGEFLNKYTSLNTEAKERIINAIYVHSDLTTEGELNHILQDADKLDGMGAIGVSRAYLTNYDKPDFEPGKVIPEPGIYGNTKTAHEQLALQLTWYGMLYTQTAKKIAKPRYEFMLTFLEEFKREVDECV